MSLSHYARNAELGRRSKLRMQRTGFTPMGHKLWSEEERKVLIDLAGDYSAMQRALKHRTRFAIKGQCAAMGLQRPVQVHYWSAAEVTKLRRMYPTEAIDAICAVFPHSSWVNICQVARYHQFRRKKRPYKTTGIAALDDVRRRCHEIGWSMSDLDQAAKTGRYFRRGGWYGKKINHRALGRAIEALDGQVAARWND